MNPLFSALFLKKSEPPFFHACGLIFLTRSIKVICAMTSSLLKVILVISCVYFIWVAPVSGQINYDDSLFWSRIQIEAQAPQLQSKDRDSMMLLISNRHRQDGLLRFMGNRSTDSSLSYFLVYARNGQWNLFPLKDLAQGLEFFDDPNQDWLIYVEGMGKVFCHGISRGLRVANQYQVNLIYLDYPSTHGQWKGIRNFFYARSEARHAHWDFFPAFVEIKNAKTQGMLGTGNLSALFHSMGNILLKNLAESPGLFRINQQAWLDQLIVNAPCVPEKNHDRWLGEIKFAKRKFVLFNPQDYVLKGAQFLSLRTQLGQKTRKDRCSDVAYLNLETWAGESHNNFLVPSNDPHLYPFYYHLLHGRDVADLQAGPKEGERVGQPLGQGGADLLNSFQ